MTAHAHIEARGRGARMQRNKRLSPHTPAQRREAAIAAIRRLRGPLDLEDGYQRLAFAVVESGVLDLITGHDFGTRISAALWMGTIEFGFWCRLADLNDEWVLSTLDRLGYPPSLEEIERAYER